MFQLTSITAPVLRAFLRAFALAVLLFPAVYAYGNDAREQWHRDIGDGYTQLMAEARNLSIKTNEYCETSGDDILNAVKAEWKSAWFAWQRVRFVGFGPVEKDNLSSQFQFWPDPKNLVANKVNSYLKSETPLSLDFLTTAGVTVQGFPAVEFLLFDEEFQKSSLALPSARSCELLSAVTARIRYNSTTLAQGWQDFRSQYLDNDEYTAITIKSAINAIDFIRDHRLGAPMGIEDNEERNHTQADAWRSKTSLATINASFQGLQSFFLPGLITALEAEDAKSELDAVKNGFADIREQLDTLPDDISSLLADDQGYARLQSVYGQMTELEQVMSEQVAPALGIVRDANSSDGD